PFFSSCSLHPRTLHRFPTRRSSDLNAAELLGHPERADADLVGPFKDFRRQARLRIHVPFALPIGADEGGDDVIDEITAALPHQADRKSTRLNSSHVSISYAVFCLKK